MQWPFCLVMLLSSMLSTVVEYYVVPSFAISIAFAFGTRPVGLFIWVRHEISRKSPLTRFQIGTKTRNQKQQTSRFVFQKCTLGLIMDPQRLAGQAMTGKLSLQSIILRWSNWR
jgi:hypothetical protein